ncbi:SLATT domain-containing protein [Alteromonas macleodii]|uniref:SLATT domain-containing protein n=1 Tax=Alteromonas macleodii TaxID=28108 RepID=UPI002076862C|nr:SLATT domain-containing protein [Alteromonas macleodii]USI29667.1 SLATT domain-containing protein [Alteromonas macleodii]
MEQSLHNKIFKECARIEEDSEHSFKAHYNAAEFWANINLILGLPAALLGAVAGGTSATDGSQAMVTGTAFLATALITCMTFLKPSEKADAHKNAGNLYQSLRNQTRLFREIELDNDIADIDAKKRLSSFSSRRDELNASMPAIPRKAYEKAKKDIDEGRAQYKADKEA